MSGNRTRKRDYLTSVPAFAPAMLPEYSTSSGGRLSNPTEWVAHADPVPPSTVYLLGAGASAFANASPRNPPLGNQLFDCLVEESQSWRALPSEAAEEFQRNGLFEFGFEWVMKNCDERAPALVEGMAKYFLQFQPLPNCIYFEFYRRVILSKRLVAIATLNYDLLLDEVIEHLTGEIRYLGVPRRDPPPLYKLHGAPNLLPDTPPGMLRGFRVSGFGERGSVIEAPVIYVTPSEARDRYAVSDSLHPVMAMYGPGKRTLSCPSVLKDAHDGFNTLCHNASEIVIIGANYAPHDEHIWAPIAAAQARVVVVNPDQNAFRELVERRGDRPTILRHQTFRDYVLDMPTAVYGPPPPEVREVEITGG